jgi:ABC-type polysaccharide/polyol phosphate export permease
MRERILELVQYRELLFMLTWKDIRIRYKQSVMGFFWAILMPVLIVMAGVLVKKAFATFSGATLNANDVASVAVKSVPWAFVVSAIRFSTQCLVGNQNLVRKIYFPREVFPISAVLASLFDFAIASVALVLLCAAMKIGISVHLLWLPLLLGLLVLWTLGVGMILSCANLFFRDVKYLVEVFLTFGIFFTPVFYSAEQLGNWGTVVLLHPVSPLLEAINAVVVLHQPPALPWVAYAAICGVVGLAAASTLFDRAQHRFAEIA